MPKTLKNAQIVGNRHILVTLSQNPEAQSMRPL